MLMTKVVYLEENDRKLILETRQKLDEVTKLMGELLETIEILSDPEMMKSIREGLEDIKAGRVKELHSLLEEEAH
jgi:PHD/YefM family antitoxin component YafN of YafNO toxin-antitoxin module